MELMDADDRSGDTLTRVMAYEMLSGHTAFGLGPMAEVAIRQRDGAPTRGGTRGRVRAQSRCGPPPGFGGGVCGDAVIARLPVAWATRPALPAPP
jgi:hypothetical protein